jgi:hypothetical protein
MWAGASQTLSIYKVQSAFRDNQSQAVRLLVVSCESATWLRAVPQRGIVQRKQDGSPVFPTFLHS